MHHSKRNEGKKGKREKTKNKKQNNSDIVTVFGKKKTFKRDGLLFGLWKRVVKKSEKLSKFCS